MRGSDFLLFSNFTMIYITARLKMVGFRLRASLENESCSPDFAEGSAEPADLKVSV